MNMHRIAAVGTLALLGLGTLGWSVASNESASSAVTSATAGTYNVDSTHSSVIFRIKHAGVTNFYGRFNKLSGSWTFDPDDLSAAAFEFEIDNDSVSSGVDNRDKHIKSPDFFNVVQFPTTTFKGTKLEAAEGGNYTLTGDFTFHGETHPITATFEYLGEGKFRGNDIASFEAIFEFNRRDYGMSTYGADDGSDSGTLGNNVKVIVSVESRKQ